MTIVASNSITVSNVNDGTITHTAYANSADGTNGFTTVYPNLNLLAGTKDFSGSSWVNLTLWQSDGTYKGLTVKSTQSNAQGLFQRLTISEDGDYVFSVYVSATNGLKPILIIGKNGVALPSSQISSSPSDMTRISYLAKGLKKGDVMTGRIEKGADDNSKVSVAGHKWEKSSTATPWMSSSSEVTTADWPSYMGQYSDFTSTSSTDPTKYAPWTVFKGNDGATGPQGPQGLKGDPGATGIPGQAGADGKTTYLHIAYATNSTGTAGFDVSNATGKTYIGQYTDFTSADSTDPSKYIWSLIKGDKGDKGDQGDQGPAGSNGDPGKIVSDTEPTTRFEGLTWKYSGTSDLTASDGTVILSGTEYYWSGTNWILSEINAHNINGNNLTITDGEFSSTIIDGPVQIQTEIKDDHLLIYKMDTSHNEIHTIALKSDSGLGMTYQNSDTGEYTSAGVNFQGLFMQNNITNEFARLTPQGTKLSTDVPWTTLSPTNGFSGGSIQFSVQNAVAYFSVSGLGVPAMSANQWYRIATLPTGSSAIPKTDRVTVAFGNASVWGFLVNSAGGLYVQCKAAVSATSNLVNVLAPFPIG